MKYLRLLLLGVFLVFPASGQDAGSGSQVPILMEASLPAYPAIWRAAHLSGNIVVRAIIRNGRVAETDVVHGESHLDIPTIANLKTWRFDSDVNTSITIT